MPPPHRSPAIPPSGSLLLDAVRIGAAFAVIFGHSSDSFFSSAWGHYYLKASLAGVAIFFVLSGFVIRLITTSRPLTARTYAVDRASRIYSALFPALAVTLLIGWHLGQLPPTPVLLQQLLTNLTFTAQCWGLDLPVVGNGVLWSLCYECAFYAFYGIAFFSRGWPRALSLALLALCVGTPILVMLPLWLLGCLLHDLYQKLRPRPLAGILWTLATVTALAAIAVALRSPLRHLAHTVIPLMHPILTLAQTHNLHLLQRASPFFYVVGIPTAVALLLLLLAVEKIRIDPNHPIARAIRIVANGTFALYLLHLPLLELVAAHIPHPFSSKLQALSVLALIVALATAAEIPMDRLKNRMRS